MPCVSVTCFQTKSPRNESSCRRERGGISQRNSTSQPQQYVPTIRWHDGQSEAVNDALGTHSVVGGGQVGGNSACVRRDRGDPKFTTYKACWLNSQRCILPVAGFYAWQLTPQSTGNHISCVCSSELYFGLAGIWDRSVGEDDDVIESCSIIRLPANKLMTDIVNAESRMPAILRRRDYQIWLRGTPVEAKGRLAILQTELDAGIRGQSADKFDGAGRSRLDSSDSLRAANYRLARSPGVRERRHW